MVIEDPRAGRCSPSAPCTCCAGGARDDERVAATAPRSGPGPGARGDHRHPARAAAGEITGDNHLKDLGADSVDRVEIIMALIDGSASRADGRASATVPDIDALVDFLVEARRR